MNGQTICQIIIFVGALLSGAGALGSFHFRKADEASSKAAAAATQKALSDQIDRLQSGMDSNTELLVEAVNLRRDVWMQVEMTHVPPGVTDYLLLLFRSNHGRISGKIRIKGSQHTAFFSTTVNDRTAVAVPNLWLPDQDQYQVPTILEYAVTEQTDVQSALSIYTQGWIDRRGQEPH